MSSKVRDVAFDEQFLYVKHKGAEVLIPLENIKDVEIKSIGGVYRLDLRYEDVVGAYFYFKPSLLYPVNFKSMDLRVDDLRDAIEKAKKRPQVVQTNALMS